MKQDTSNGFTIRPDADMRAWLEDQAAAQRRSLSNMVLVLLEELRASKKKARK